MKHTKETKEKIRQSMLQLYREGKRVPPMGMLGKHLSKEHKRKISVFQTGIKRSDEMKHKLRLARLGSKNPAWKGGRMIDSGGYIQLCKSNHPNSVGGYVPEHRFVMEQDMGRFLNSGEIVHHLDGDMTNNQINNLHLFPNPSEHMKYHRFLQKSVVEMIQWQQ